MTRFIAATTLVLSVATLAGCASTPEGPLDPVAVPLNPGPQQVVSASGTVVAGFSVPELIVVYATTLPRIGFPAKECAAWINHIEGVSGSKTIELHVPATTRDGHVSAEVQIDRYAPGKCNWLLREVDAVVVDDGTGKRGTFRIGYGLDRAKMTDPELVTNPNGRVTFHCMLITTNFACMPKVPSTEGTPIPLGPSTRLLQFEVQSRPAGAYRYS